jgi:hypothetical protein
MKVNANATRDVSVVLVPQQLALKTSLPEKMHFMSSEKAIRLVELGGDYSLPMRQTEGLSTQRPRTLMSKGLWSTHSVERRDHSLMRGV